MIAYTFRLENNRPILSQPETVPDVQHRDERAQAFGEATQVLDTFQGLTAELLKLNDLPGVDLNDSPRIVAVAQQGDFEVAVLNQEGPGLAVEGQLTPAGQERWGVSYFSTGPNELVVHPGNGNHCTVRFDHDNGLLTYLIE